MDAHSFFFSCSDIWQLVRVNLEKGWVWNQTSSSIHLSPWHDEQQCWSKENIRNVWWGAGAGSLHESAALASPSVRARYNATSEFTTSREEKTTQCSACLGHILAITVVPASVHPVLTRIALMDPPWISLPSPPHSLQLWGQQELKMGSFPFPSPHAAKPGKVWGATDHPGGSGHCLTTAFPWIFLLSKWYCKSRFTQMPLLLLHILGTRCNELES